MEADIPTWADEAYGDAKARLVAEGEEYQQPTDELRKEMADAISGLWDEYKTSEGDLGKEIFSLIFPQ